MLSIPKRAPISLRTTIRKMASSAYASEDVLFSNKNMARVISLNRLNKLNSLNDLMVTKIAKRMVEYSKLDVCNMLILTSESPKALCAGGDVVTCAQQVLEGQPQKACDFFQHEYNLNYLISTYSKPYIALMDGITMGGGVGLSVHAPFRIATEKTKLAMPEMDIGFFPDVGTTFFLPRLDDNMGFYYALTGEVLGGLDAYMAGFATHYVPSERIPHLVNRLSNLNAPSINGVSDTSLIVKYQKQYFLQVNEIIEEFTVSKLPEDYRFYLTNEQIALINNAFKKLSLDGALAVFKSAGTEFGNMTYERISSKSPICANLTFELLKKGLKSNIRKQFELEIITATNVMYSKIEENDFVKGVKHKLIDKIKEPALPAWAPYDPARVKALMTRSIHTSKLEEPLISQFFGLTFDQYPFNMGLPTNRDVALYVTGTDGSNRSYLPTPAEVMKNFVTKTNKKLGVEAKVERILTIHGEASKYDNKYVTWVS